MSINEKMCPICGAKVEKNKSFYRFGRYFCSEEHVLIYADRVQCGCGGA